jgi:hypothetical protein
MRLYYYTSKQFGMKSLWEKRLKIGEYKDLNDPFELLPHKQRDAQSRALMKQVVSVLSKGHGVLCFSESWRSNLMWAHYADKHKGVCLGFDVPEGEVLTKIRYVSRRIDSTFDRSQPLGGIDADHLAMCLNVKASGWKYEREHRLRVRLEQKRDGIYYKPFDANVDLREVIIGARCSLSPEDVREAVGQPDSDVDIWAVRAAHTNFNMTRDAERPKETVAGIPEQLKKNRALVEALSNYVSKKPGGIIADAMKE